MKPIALFEDFLRSRELDELIELAAWCRGQDGDYGELFFHPDKKALFLCHGDAYSQYVNEVGSRAKELGYAFESDAECYPWSDGDRNQGGWRLVASRPIKEGKV